MKRRGFIQSIAAGIAALFGVRVAADRGDTPKGWRHFYNNDVNEESFAGLPDPHAVVSQETFKEFVLANYRVVKITDGADVTPVEYGLFTGGDTKRLYQAMATTVSMKKFPGDTIWLREGPTLIDDEKVVWGEVIKGYTIRMRFA